MRPGQFNDFPQRVVPPVDDAHARDERAVRIGAYPGASLPQKIMREVALRYRLKNGSYDFPNGKDN